MEDLVELWWDVFLETLYCQQTGLLARLPSKSGTHVLACGKLFLLSEFGIGWKPHIYFEANQNRLNIIKLTITTNYKRQARIQELK